MSNSPTDLQKVRNSISNRSKLGQFCGSSHLFRNRYEILRVLGKGGFGVTFLVRDVAIEGHPLCVIKQLCPKVQDPAIFQRARKRFGREAKTLRKLGDHLQIPKLLDYFEADGEFYLVQEYIRGFTLARQVRCRGPLSEKQVRRFLSEVMPILEYVHSQQVIHRDIKPPNLLRCQDDGRLVLIDFGAVKEQISWLEQTTTAKGLTTHFIGTVGFAPPEQLALRPVFATDIYAVGVTCLYLLTARPPAEFESDLVTGEIRWRDLVEVSDPFAKIIDKMLHGSLDKRYRSATDVLVDLDPSLNKELAQCMAAQVPPPSQKKDRYLTPIERRASAIRRWRDKLHGKSNVHIHSARVRKMISTSSAIHPKS